MEWLKKTVWQQGIAALLVLIGIVLIYNMGTDGVNQSLLWVGLGVAWVGLAIPLLSKVIGEEEEQEEEEDKNEEERDA